MRITIILAVLMIRASSLFAQQYDISTIAGGGAIPTPVPASSVRVPVSGALAINHAGELFFCSGNSVLKMDMNGILTRVAGTGQNGYSGDGGMASSAQLGWPAGLALDDAGNLYIAENANHRVRKVSPSGIISTVAGNGSAGYSGDGGQAVNAQLNFPIGLAVDMSGNLYIADTGNHRVRKVSVDGIITTDAADLSQAEEVAVDATGNLYILTGQSKQRVKKLVILCQLGFLRCEPPFWIMR